ncbi:bacteriocin immunity protein, partial [Escherichia coli]|nr:bacteriocin immunity protein [Escherichia coli]
MEFKNNLEDYTEDEFIELLNNFFEPPEELHGDKLSKFIDDLVSHFIRITR